MQETKNAVAPAKATFQSALSKQTDVYTNSIVATFQNVDLSLDAYQKTCLANAIGKINEVLVTSGLDFKKIDQSNLTTILSQIAMFKLNAAASPRECYFIVRKGKKDTYSLEFGIEGNGNDAILRTYGVGVKEVLTPIIIREGDEFTYPYFDGEKMQPFTWKPHSFTAKPIAVAYIIIKDDGTKEYLISEREGVAVNLRSHIANNLMWAPENVKAPILEKIQNMALDEMLNDKGLCNGVSYQKDGETKTANCISPAWKGAAREEMIIRKMRNNAIKKYPKDFKSAYIEANFENTFEDYDQYKKDYLDVTPEEEIHKLQEEKTASKPVQIEEVNETVEKKEEPAPVEEEQPKEEANWMDQYM